MPKLLIFRGSTHLCDTSLFFFKICILKPVLVGLLSGTLRDQNLQNHSLSHQLREEKKHSAFSIYRYRECCLGGCFSLVIAKYRRSGTLLIAPPGAALAETATKNVGARAREKSLGIYILNEKLSTSKAGRSCYPAYGVPALNESVAGQQ